MHHKPRRIDLHPDQFIAGIAGKLTPVELGVYWMICLRIYSHGGPIEDSEKDIAGLFQDCNPRTVRAAIAGLERKLKLHRIGSELMANGCRTELELAANRMRIACERGANGGRISGERRRDESKNNHISEAGASEASDVPPKLARDAPSLSPSIPIPPKAPHGINGHQADFKRWYSLFPNKVGRGAAIKAFPSALSRAGSIEVLIAGLKRYIADKPSDRPWCNPATWLNQDRWTDEPATALPKKGGLYGGAML